MMSKRRKIPIAKFVKVSRPAIELCVKNVCIHMFQWLKQTIGKKHALKKYDQFPLNTAFGEVMDQILPPVVQFHEIFVTKIMSKLIYYYC